MIPKNVRHKSWGNETLLEKNVRYKSGAAVAAPLFVCLGEQVE